MELIGSAEIARRLGVWQQTVNKWARTEPKFPAPVGRAEQTALYDWTKVERWARRTGRLGEKEN